MKEKREQIKVLKAAFFTTEIGFTKPAKPKVLACLQYL
jgi:hypothetical protein